MGCEREQNQPSEHWQTLGWSRKSTGTQKQHTPPESAYRLGLDSDSAAWVFRQLWRKNCCSALGGRTAVLPFKRRLKIGHSLSSMCHSWSLAECGQPNADSSFSNFTLAANSQRLWP